MVTGVSVNLYRERRRKMKGKTGMVVLTAALLVALAVIGSIPTASAFQEKDLVIMSSVVGGVGFQNTTAVAKAIRKVAPDIRLTMESTSGYIDNAKRMFAGYGHMGLVAHDTARLAAAKKDFFAREGKRLYAIAPVHKLQWHIIVNADSPIKTIWDLKEKRVNLQPKWSSAEKTGSALFGALDIPITPSYYRHSEAAQALKTGSIDAHWLGGSTAVFMEYSMRTPIRVIELSDSDVKMIIEKLPHISQDQFPAGAYYKGTPEKVQSIATWALWMCREGVSDELAYAVAKAVHEHKDLLVSASKATEVIDVKNIQYVTVPLHPGAVKFYKEQGAEIPATAMPQ
jgi:hypothetical protein